MNLIIFSAPSGAGKTTIVKNLLGRDINLEFSISATSREIRGEEEHAKDYYFYNADEFRRKVDANEFAEWEEVYKDHYYGTLKTEIERIWSNGNHVLFDIDVAGGINLKKQYGKQALAIFIMPPSENTLQERLEDRATDSAEKIEMRLQKSRQEIDMAGEFDKIVINDNLEETCEEVYSLVIDFLKL